jgi:hypothetical protein
MNGYVMNALTNQGMLKGIHVKLLSSCVLIWDRDRPIARNMVLL